jgi:hypothetical protein
VVKNRTTQRELDWLTNGVNIIAVNHRERKRRLFFICSLSASIITSIENQERECDCRVDAMIADNRVRALSIFVRSFFTSRRGWWWSNDAPTNSPPFGFTLVMEKIFGGTGRESSIFKLWRDLAFVNHKEGELYLWKGGLRSCKSIGLAVGPNLILHVMPNGQKWFFAGIFHPSEFWSDHQTLEIEGEKQEESLWESSEKNTNIII